MLTVGVAVMVRDKYAVRLVPEQREELQNLIRVGESSARVHGQGADSAQERRWLGRSPGGRSLGRGAGHRAASLYETFPVAEARRIAKRLEFHYTPKRGSWLNMAEIEFSVLSRSCLKQRLPDEDALGREVQALVRERNAARVGINWRFKTQEARTKLHHLYPFDSKVD